MPFYLNAQVNLSNGLVAYYPFNGTFNDASGNGNNGTGMGGVTFGTDQWGNPNNAASFNGIDSWVSIPPAASITPGHNLTATFRFKTNIPTRQYLIAKSDINTYFDFSYNIGINDPIPSQSVPTGLVFATAHETVCQAPTLAGNNYAATGTAIDTGKWYCAVVSFDSGVKKVYLNGILVVTQVVSGVPIPGTIDSCSGAGLKFGVWHSLDPAWFNGLMDEVRIYNRSLNSQEIDSLCKLVIKPKPTSIINNYAAIKSGGPCGNSYVVDSAQGFAAGDTVLMIQMKGASIDSSNTAAFGTVSNYNGAGNYEKNVIKSVTGNTISLLYKLQRNYDIPQGKVQFVRIPFYKNYTISNNHTCMLWNGEKGGVFAINVSGTLTLSDSIDVSGKGFRAGLGYTATHSNNTICNYPDFYNPPNIDSSAQKGEGIVNLSISKSYARGAAANGGGGGNAHNAGGGGGSNGGAAGIGGSNYAGCPSTTTNITGGIGGIGLAINGAANKIFMGGGGGAGHSNDQTNSDGGAGGGIIFIQAGKISSFNRSIVANGLNGAICTTTIGTYPCTDGMGGGGGAGTVIVDCPTYTGGIKVFTNGGNGADVTGAAAFSTLILGPGGGGSGGVLWVSTPLMPSAVTFTSNGGKNGVNVNQSNNAMGAQSGNPGLSISNLKILEPIDTFKNNPLKFDFNYKVIGCYTAQFTPSSTPGIISYSWLFGTFASSTQQSPIQVFPGEGTYSVTLTVTDSNGCTYSITKPVVIIAYKGF
ncbi:MAG: LamG-like jellyroll fold domain-containing protein, partial [Chitinophagaceae bacterium]